MWPVIWIFRYVTKLFQEQWMEYDLKSKYSFANQGKYGRDSGETVSRTLDICQDEACNIVL